MIVRPLRSKLMLVPQKPYSFDGTLAQQVVYPYVAAPIDEQAVKVCTVRACVVGFLTASCCLCRLPWKARASRTSWSATKKVMLVPAVVVCVVVCVCVCVTFFCAQDCKR